MINSLLIFKEFKDKQFDEYENGNFFKILYIKAALYFTDCLIYFLDLLIIIVKKDIFQVSALNNVKNKHSV